MEEQRNNIDHFFREGLGSYTETPPPAVWDALEKKLDGPKKRMPYLWFLLAFVSTSAVLGFLATQHSGAAIATGTEKNMVLPAATQPAIGAAHNNGATSNTVASAEPRTSTTAAVANGIAGNTEKNTTVKAQGTQGPTPNNDNSAGTTTGTHKTTAPLAYGEQTINKYTGNLNKGTDIATTQADKHIAEKSTGAAVANTVTKTTTNATSATQTSNATNNVANTVATGNTNNIAAITTVVKDTKPVANNTGNTTGNTVNNIANTTITDNTSNVATPSVVANNSTSIASAKETTTTTSKKNSATVAASITPAGGDNNKTEKVAAKQNNIKAASETPASVLAADKEQKTTEQQLPLATTTQTMSTNRSAGAQQTTTANVRAREAKPMFTETVTTIIVPATGTGNNNGAPGDAVAKDKKPSKLEFGIKAGYETGTKTLHASKYDVAPYIKYNISKRASIIVQPGIKLASISNVNVDPSKSYYNITSSSVDSQTSGIAGGNATTKYKYSEQGDSFRVSHSIAQRTFFEMELPVMFSYQVTKNLSIQAGFAMIYSKLVGLSKDSSDHSTFSRQGTVTYTVPYGTITQPPPISSAIPHTALPYLTLANASYQAQSGSVFTLGYLLGFSYMLTPRWMIDGLVQQNVAGIGSVKNYDIKSLYTQPYVRLMLGFKITKPREQ